MARECKCLRNYEINFSDGELRPLFIKDNIYFFFNKGDSFYISNDKKYLKDMVRFDINIELMEIEEFDEYFEYTKKYNTQGEKQCDMVKQYINRYNELFEKYHQNDFDELFGNEIMSEVDLRQFIKAERKISQGGIFYDND